jgi:hypothetical protein
LWDCPAANLTFWFPMACLNLVKLPRFLVTWVVAPKSKYQLVSQYVGFSNKSNRFFKVKTCWTFVVNFSLPTFPLIATHFLMSLNTTCSYCLMFGMCSSISRSSTISLLWLCWMVLIVGWLPMFCCCCDPCWSLGHSLTQCPSWQ